MMPQRWPDRWASEKRPNLSEEPSKTSRKAPEPRYNSRRRATSVVILLPQRPANRGAHRLPYRGSYCTARAGWR